MTTRKRYHQLSEKDYRMIKQFLDADIPVIKVSEATGRSSSTVARIVRSATYSDYKNLTAAGKVPKVQTPEITYDGDLAKLLTNINETVVQIDTRLQWLEQNVAIPSEKTKTWFAR